MNEETIAKSDLHFYLDYFPNLRNVFLQILPPWNESRDYNGLADSFVFSQDLISSEGYDETSEDVWVYVEIGETFVTRPVELGFEEVCGTRGYRWLQLSGGHALLLENPGLYDELKSKVKLTPFAEAEIRKDVYRTNRQQDLWTSENRLKKQEQVFNVLKVFSSYLKQIGYCQGMGCVSALLLHELSEEQTFWIMVALTTDPRYKLWGFWHPKMPLVHQIFENMEKLVETYFPDLADHFRSEGVVSCTMYGVCTWFITIFVATKLPISLIYEIWDLYFEHGLEVIYKIGLGILFSYRDDLLNKKFDDIIRCFRSEFYEVNEKNFVTESFRRFQLPEFIYSYPFDPTIDLRKQLSSNVDEKMNSTKNNNSLTN